MKKLLALATVLTIACVQTVQAAFIVEPLGLASSHYAYTGAGGTAASTTATAGTAPGLTAASTIFGGNGTTDQYTFTYTPGTDVDNYSPTAGLLLGDNFTVANYATGRAGGGSGLYNVYATWIYSTNVGSPTTTPNCDFFVSNDGATVQPPTVNQNTDQSGSPGGNGGWFLIAGDVPLTAGNSYTVVMDSIVDNYVSMRSAGVMWEMVPEPSALTLSVLGGALLFGFISRRRNS